MMAHDRLALAVRSHVAPSLGRHHAHRRIAVLLAMPMQMTPVPCNLGVRRGNAECTLQTLVLHARSSMSILIDMGMRREHGTRTRKTLYVWA